MLKKACSIAEIMEMAERKMHDFHSSSSQTIQVNKVMEQESKNTERLSLYSPHCKTLWVVPVPRRNLTNPAKLYRMVIAFQYLLN